MKKKNVLVTGIGQVNYILQLYSQIAPQLTNFQFNSLNLRSFGNIPKERAKKTFRNNYNYEFNYSNLIDAIRSILEISLNRYFWKHLGILLSEKGFRFITRIIPAFKEHIQAHQLANFIDRHTDTHIIHLHFPKQEYALFVNYLKKDYQIIVTYWGSDIYRIKKRVDYEIQKQIIPQTKIITVATPEMKFALITRYGSGFENKIKIARFIHDWSFYQLADTFMNKTGWKTSFLKERLIPEDKKIILFGHNAFEENNHLRFLEALKLIPSDILENYHVIFPLTYPNDNNEYIKKIKDYSNDIPVSFTYLTEFLSWEDMAKLKIVSEIYIHAPSTDGLSAFLTEFFFTGNLAIVGSWLPYKTFLKYGIKYLEFDNFIELSDILQISKDYSIDTSNNKDIVGRNFNSLVIAKEWINVFNDLSK